MGTWHITFIHRGNGKWLTEGKHQGCQGETHPQIITGLCHCCPVLHLPPLAISGKFLGQGLPQLLLLPVEETMISGYALIIHDTDRNVSGFHAIEFFF
jgi:hypothetical protein